MEEYQTNNTRRIIIDEEPREGPQIDNSTGKRLLILNPEGKFPFKFSTYSAKLIVQVPDVISSFVESEAKELGDDVPEGVIIEEYKGSPLLVLNATGSYPFRFGLYKARLIIENMEAIKKFVASDGAEV